MIEYILLVIFLSSSGKPVAIPYAESEIVKTFESPLECRQFAHKKKIIPDNFIRCEIYDKRKHGNKYRGNVKAI